MLWIFVLALTLSAHADNAVPTTGNEILIDVGQAQIKKSLLALTPLLYLGTQKTNAAHIQIGQNLYRVMMNDLTVANLFTMIKPDAYLENPAKIGLKPAPYEPNGFNFANWKTIGTEFLVRSAYQVLDNELVFEAYVYHVPTARMVLGKTYKSTLNGYRKIAHMFCNDFVKALTGKRGMFLTRLVASKQEPGSQIKEIYLMDWDGFNPQRITHHESISISPAWSTGGDKIAYTDFAYHGAQRMRNSDLFVYDIPTGKRFLLSYRKGINSGAAYLPGDKSLLLTMSKEGASDIYRSSADGVEVSPLTNGPNRALNVEPAVSPDGKTVAFSSDRSGKPMLYLMNIDGSRVRRLTFAGKYNASPAWSPDGKTIVFASQDRDHFDIFTMTSDGSNLKRLTEATKPNGRGANNESPSFSPDGRAILFTSDRSGKYQLYLISPDGTGERRITEDNANWDKPKWSPYLD
jgi:TolB protein